MIWMRETANGVFETPERKAELEARIRAVTNLVKNESVRRHYEQDMRDRLFNFFQNRQQFQGGQGYSDNARAGKGAANTNRPFQKIANPRNAGIGASTTLLNSSLIKKGKARIPLREAALVMGVVNHPALLTRFFDEFAALHFSSQLANDLRQMVIDIFARFASVEQGLSVEQLRDNLIEAGGGDVLQRMDEQLAQNRVWQTGVSAAFEDAADGWRQAYLLHVRNHTLHRELKAAEMALASDGNDENLDRFLHIQAELAKDEGMEALIDGFGLSSGRPSRSF